MKRPRLNQQITIRFQHQINLLHLRFPHDTDNRFLSSIPTRIIKFRYCLSEKIIECLHLRKTALDDGEHDLLGRLVDMAGFDLVMDFLDEVKDQGEPCSNILVDFGSVGDFFMEGVESADDFAAEVDELDDGGYDPYHGKSFGHDPFMLLTFEYGPVCFKRSLKAVLNAIVVRISKVERCWNSGGLGGAAKLSEWRGAIGGRPPLSRLHFHWGHRVSASWQAVFHI
jgi:hypothetical protein